MHHPVSALKHDVLLEFYLGHRELCKPVPILELITSETRRILPWFGKQQVLVNIYG